MRRFVLKNICGWLAAMLLLMGLPDKLTGQIGSMRPFGELHALVVGVSKYQNPHIDSLRFAHRDAEVFADFLQNEALWNVEAEHLTVLTNAEATYGAFINSLQALSEQCRPGDRLLLYFAGHGDVERTAEDDLGYLLLHDASATTYAAGGACNVVTLDAFLRKLVLDKDVEVIFISDACRAGSLAGSGSNGAQTTASAMAHLFTNTIKILSCEPQQYSLEDERWGNGRGLFSYYLVKGLRGEADQNNDRYVEILELERYVQDSVRAESGFRQTPFALGGASATRLNKVPEQIDHPKPAGPVPARRYTSYLPILDAFEQALTRKQLLYPQKGSALALYESLQNYLAVMYAENNHTQKAIQELQKTIAPDSSFAEAYYNLAYLYIEEPDRRQEAAATMSKYLELEPADADGYSMLGYILDQLQKPRPAYGAKNG